VRGERVAMLVHHSRNSVQKQWEETLVLALGGMARILRAHLPTLVPMSGFAQVCSPPSPARSPNTHEPQTSCTACVQSVLNSLQCIKQCRGMSGSLRLPCTPNAKP
jgi:hypothetical protein